MNKLRECRNFGELYEAIGEENFGKGAFFLTILLFSLPIFAGIINWRMLYYPKEPYYAYKYNYWCITLWFISFSLMTLWAGIYLLGKMQAKRLGVKATLKRIREKQGWLLWWIMLLLWSVIPVACSYDPVGAILGISQLAGGYITHIYMIGVLACVYMIADKKQRDCLMWIFLAVMDFLAVVMLAREYNIPFFKLFSATTGLSVYTNSNHYGYVITMAKMVISGLYYKCLTNSVPKQILKQVICLVSIVLHAWAIVMNDTLGSYLAIVFTLFILPFMWWKRTGIFLVRYYIPIVIAILFAIMGYEGLFLNMLGSNIGKSFIIFIEDLFRVSHKSEGYIQAGTNRIALWLDTIDKIKQRPIVGYGPEIIIYGDNNAILMDTPHNEFLECAYFLGIPGLILYLGGLISLCRKKIRLMKQLTINELIAAGVVIGYLASSFFGVRKFNTVCYFFVFIGIMMRDFETTK